jgi:hypothetical protein
MICGRSDRWGCKGYLKAQYAVGMNFEWHTFETDFVPLKTLHSLLEQGLAGRGHSRHIVLLPLNGSVHMLEDLLD